jgi:hypothetical protein
MTDVLVNSKKGEIVKRFEKRLEALFQKCESPIERLFLTYFYDYCDFIFMSRLEFITHEVVPENEGTDNAYFSESFDLREGCCFFKIIGLQLIENDIGDETRTSIYPQYEVQYADTKYRLDFAVIIERKGERKLLGIECDGHEWHSTKERIKLDNQRMRNLHGLGWQIFRYSGSELFADTFKCILDFERNAIYQMPDL